MTPTSNIKKIVVIGPESTGKSTLCGYLANYYNTLWCPEFAREYLLENGTAYTLEDLITIAKGQLAATQKHIEDLEKRTATSNTPTPLIIDTDMYVMKVWSEYVFGNCPSFILDEINYSSTSESELSPPETIFNLGFFIGIFCSICSFTNFPIAHI